MSALARRLMVSGPVSNPGSQTTTYDAATDTGYDGEVTAAELISGDSLASTIGLTAGTPYNSAAGWLKFWVGPNASCNRSSPGTGYVLYVAKKPIRYNLSWDAINTARAVDGSGETITIGSDEYKVRLLTGGDANPTTYGFNVNCTHNAGGNSEWNALMYRVHTDIPNCTDVTEGMPEGHSTDRHGGLQNGTNWDDLTDTDLLASYSVGSGAASWCQEVSNNSSLCVIRGGWGIAGYNNYAKGNPSAGISYRPVLELVQ